MSAHHLLNPPHRPLLGVTGGDSLRRPSAPFPNLLITEQPLNRLNQLLLAEGVRRQLQAVALLTQSLGAKEENFGLKKSAKKK